MWFVLVGWLGLCLLFYVIVLLCFGVRVCWCGCGCVIVVVGVVCVGGVEYWFVVGCFVYWVG